MSKHLTEWTINTSDPALLKKRHSALSVQADLWKHSLLLCYKDDFWTSPVRTGRFNASSVNVIFLSSTEKTNVCTITTQAPSFSSMGSPPSLFSSRETHLTFKQNCPIFFSQTIMDKCVWSGSSAALLCAVFENLLLTLQSLKMNIQTISLSLSVQSYLLSQPCVS